MVRDFVMFGNLIDDSGVAPNKVRWPAINDPTDFPVIASPDAAAKQSDEQVLPEGGAIS